MLFRAAHDALQLPHAGEEEAGMTDGRLRARVAAWERERNWAPAWVDEQLAATHQRRDQLVTDATVWDARADAPGVSDADAARLRADAAAARTEAAQLAEQLAQLEFVDDARAQWAATTAVTRDKAERSDFELRARGVDRDTGEAKVTGDQWLEIHRAEQAEADRYREVRDDFELTDNHADAVADEPVMAVQPQRDIRETAVRDPGEDGDRRPRVPVVDETTATVARAGAALDELHARGAAEQAHADEEAAERDAAEQERRAELTRWSAEETESGRGDSHSAERDDESMVRE